MRDIRPSAFLPSRSIIFDPVAVRIASSCCTCTNSASNATMSLSASDPSRKQNVERSVHCDIVSVSSISCGKIAYLI